MQEFQHTVYLPSVPNVSFPQISVNLSKKTYLVFWIKTNPTPPASLGDTWGSGGCKGGGVNKGAGALFPKIQTRAKTAKKTNIFCTEKIHGNERHISQEKGPFKTIRESKPHLQKIRNLEKNLRKKTSA